MGLLIGGLVTAILVLVQRANGLVEWLDTAIVGAFMVVGVTAFLARSFTDLEEEDQTEDADASTQQDRPF